MREPTYPIIVALAAMLVAPPFSAFAQREERGPSRLEEQTPLRTPEEQTPLRKPEEQTPLRTPQEQTPLRTQTFAGHAYHGQVAWMVAGITRRATVWTAGGGMWADTGILSRADRRAARLRVRRGGCG
jgi:hypothetical protein